ncbi:hypothetical protein D4R52_02880 [bacterium]|nr:MAG: hypothetical protein D4R52_02880 [bacterium]
MKELCLRREYPLQVRGWLHSQASEVLGHQFFRVIGPKKDPLNRNYFLLQVSANKLPETSKLALPDFHVLGHERAGASHVFSVIPIAPPVLACEMETAAVSTV